MRDDATKSFGDVTPFRNPRANWDDADPSHPGYLEIYTDDTPGPKAYLIHMEAKPGKEE